WSGPTRSRRPSRSPSPRRGTASSSRPRANPASTSSPSRRTSSRSRGSTPRSPSTAAPTAGRPSSSSTRVGSIRRRSGPLPPASGEGPPPFPELLVPPLPLPPHDHLGQEHQEGEEGDGDRQVPVDVGARAARRVVDGAKGVGVEDHGQDEPEDQGEEE